MIPRHIYQTFKTRMLSKEMEEIQSSWKQKNPEYDYTFMDDSECLDFLTMHFSEDVVTTYRRIVPGALKADLWRYCIVYKYGGIYADLDTICMNSIDSYIIDRTFVTVIDLNTNPAEGKYNLFNTFIASIPGHPILKGCIDRIVRQVGLNQIPRSPLDWAGPGVLGRETNRYLGRPEESSFVGKEGLHDNEKLQLLHFNGNGEYVGFVDGSILFQNKNGNSIIRSIYEKECKNARVIGWLSTRPWI